MLLNTLFTILGIFILISFESFFVTLASFSILIIVIFFLLDKWDWKKWILFVILTTILIDVTLHRMIGVTIFAVAISSLILYLMFLIMPKKEVLLSYLPYFIAILIYYLLVRLVGPFVQDRVWGVITWNMVIGDLVKSLLSTVMIFIINVIFDNFRGNEQLRL